jgi:hypothetical protein
LTREKSENEKIRRGKADMERATHGTKQYKGKERKEEEKLQRFVRRA